MFNVSQHIIGEAKELLGQKAPLPQQITSATSFYVAEASDHSVLAFARLVFEGKDYKIRVIKKT